MRVKTRGDRRQRPSGQDTRAAILEAARTLFTRHGYVKVSMEQIQARAGISRGGIYHHFTSKVEVLAALCEQVESEIMARVVAAAGDIEDPLERLVAGGHAYLDEWVDAPEVVQICLLGGRHVLPWQRWRDIAARHGLGLVTGVVREAFAAGRIPEQDADALSMVLTGAYIEAGTMIALSPDPRQARRKAGAATEALVRGLASMRTSGRQGSKR